MKTMSRRERLMVMAAVGVALVIGVPALLDTPSGKGPRSLAAERRKHQEVQGELARVRAEIEALEGAVQARALPGTVRQVVPEIVQAAQKAAKTAGVQLSDVKPISPENISGLQRVPVQMNVSARFPQAARFLYELQRGNNRYRVDQFRMLATDPQTDRLDLELRLVGYVKEVEDEDVPGT